MPHLILEYTANLHPHADRQALFHRLHETMMASGEFLLDEIKSRAICLDDYFVGAGGDHHAFAHLKIHMLDKRDGAVMARIAQSLLPVLSEAYQTALTSLQCQICVEVVPIRSDGYFKVVS
ncbi:5-carboxymethyl-2-hydroxymuconate isomerase [Chitinivorax tropicus]|uniref:5-carboxymethyl-2-hydroxymuconate isomerase n=1 Tax=Chitinivorax tropicus TaxID=714531 RepID=A0A840MMF5_9PROT|nr:5-carboxymethyl-2-hydroxymuconate Delta-isomerase [Chitinivorax tropicus]MBB5019600.1 5-carboxymethyl-2-hydroxymuconate isomerase [Chitinivorax tropicus]